MTDGRALRLIPIAVALIASLLYLPYLAMHADPAFPVDDAYISFRYAVNLAVGEGLVFNHGERVEGYSNLSWVLLLAVCERLGVSPPLAARALSLACTAFTLLLLLCAFRPRAASGAVVVAGTVLTGVALLLHPLTLPNLMSGLEQPLVAALVTLLTIALVRQSPWLAAGTSLALSISRPEGAILAGVAALVTLIGAILRRAPLRPLARPWGMVWALPMLGLTAWRWWYYGDVVPNSVRAKAGAAPLETLRASAPLVIEYFAETWPLLVIGVAVIALRSVRLRTVAAWLPLAPATALVAVNLIIASGDPYYGWHRYLYPGLPLLAASPLALCGELSLRPCRLARDHVVRWAGAFAAVALVVWAVHFVRVLDPGAEVRPTATSGSHWSLLWRQDRAPDLHLEGAPDDPRLALFSVARWLRSNAKAGATVATAEIGVVGYYTDLHVVDIFGLTNPEVRHQAGAPGWKMRPEAILGRRPDLVLNRVVLSLPLIGLPSDVMLLYDRTFRSTFSLVHVFGSGETGVLAFRRIAENSSRLAHDLVFELRPDSARAEGPRCCPEAAIPAPTILPDTSLEQTSAKESTVRALRRAATTGTMPAWLPEALRQHQSPRRHLILHRPLPLPCRSTLRFPLRVPPAAQLEGTLGMLREAWREELGDGAVYEIEVEDAAGKRSLLARRAIDPKQRPEDRRWFWYRADLSPWSGQQVTFVFTVLPGDSGDVSNDDGGWGQPQVVVGAGNPISPS